jgi:hypothetical protein
MRTCQFPGCSTILRSYNQDKFCSLHQCILCQNDVMYEKNKFYLVKAYGNEKLKIRLISYVVERLREVEGELVDA